MTSNRLHSTTVDDPQSLTHFGVTGMHWGVRHSREDLLAKAKNHENIAKGNANLAEHYKAEHDELMARGLNSSAGRRVYGDNVGMQTDLYFRLKNGQTRGQATDQLSNSLRLLHNHHVRVANHHTKRAEKLRAKAETMQHGEVFVMETDEAVDDFLMHFGVKGMHWGTRKNRSSEPPSSDAAAAAAAHEKAKTGGGTHVLSNSELEALTKRLNLEQQYKRLTTPTGPSNAKKGRDFIGDVIGIGKMGVDAYETGKKISKIVDEVTKDKKK